MNFTGLTTKEVPGGLELHNLTSISQVPQSVPDTDRAALLLSQLSAKDLVIAETMMKLVLPSDSSTVIELLNGNFSKENLLSLNPWALVKLLRAGEIDINQLASLNFAHYAAKDFKEITSVKKYDFGNEADLKTLLPNLDKKEITHILTEAKSTEQSERWILNIKGTNSKTLSIIDKHESKIYNSYDKFFIRTSNEEYNTATIPSKTFSEIVSKMRFGENYINLEPYIGEAALTKVIDLIIDNRRPLIVAMPAGFDEFHIHNSNQNAFFSIWHDYFHREAAMRINPIDRILQAKIAKSLINLYSSEKNSVFNEILPYLLDTNHPMEAIIETLYKIHPCFAKEDGDLGILSKNIAQKEENALFASERIDFIKKIIFGLSVENSMSMEIGLNLNIHFRELMNFYDLNTSL